MSSLPEADDALAYTYANAEHAQLRSWVALDTREKIAFFEEMIQLAHASGALAPERLALRDAPSGRPSALASDLGRQGGGRSHEPVAVRVVPYRSEWAVAFDAEAARILAAVGEAVVRIHHIGSTAIAQMPAKPVIDMLLEVSSLDAMDEATQALAAIGYEAKGEFGIPGRRYFRLDDPSGTRTHQIHAFEAGSADVHRHIAFRDYMRTHPAVAHEYGVLKQRLAEESPNDLAAYIEGKDAFVRLHERRALLWASRQ